jgi:starch synthase
LISVLAVASEMFPLVKTGGLGDVTGGLPAALATEGATATTLLPGYPAVLQGITDAVPLHRFPDLFGGPAQVLRAIPRATPCHAPQALLILDAPHLYHRPGNPYLGPDGKEWPDNPLRFAGLGAAAAAIATGVIPGTGFDIVHAHDWQAAMAVVYLHFHPGPRPATVLTVHNLAFQGRYPATLFPRLGLPASAFALDGMEFHSDVNFLKGGLSYADRITTVSPTYAREITAPEDGMGLDGVLRHRSAVLSGILNGIDDTVWNPATDPLIPAPYSRATITARAANKTALQQRLHLRPSPGSPLIGIVSRLTSQKGLDLLVDRLAPLAATGFQLALLGSGDKALEEAFQEAAERHQGSVGCIIGYDENVAHLIQAGSDALLVPSRFEPCGLTQLYALRYGAIPVVSRVGGLAESVIDANHAALAAGVATGIQFSPTTGEGLDEALQRLLTLWHDRPAWLQMQRNGMGSDVSWRVPARRYVALFRSLLPEPSRLEDRGAADTENTVATPPASPSRPRREPRLRRQRSNEPSNPVLS